MKFENKLVLITGSSRGIGRAVAKEFLLNGARVAINGRSGESVAAARASLPNPKNIEAAPGDISTVDGCMAVVTQAVGRLGGLDVLVNAAGVWRTASVEDSDEALWDAVVGINLKGSFFCARAALPALRKAGGVIVNIASDAGLMGLIDNSVYCASKGGVVNMTRAMALELAPAVRVNCICPGYVDTDMVRRDHLEKQPDPAAAEAAVNRYAPLHRMARPGEIAKAVAYLASADAAYVTGSILQIDGGSTAGSRL